MTLRLLVADNKGGTLQLRCRAILDTLTTITTLCAEQCVVEHRGARHVRATTERYLLGRARIAILVGLGIEVATYYGVERITAYEVIDMILEVVPRTTASIKRIGVLGCNVREVEDLSIGLGRRCALRRA